MQDVFESCAHKLRDKDAYDKQTLEHLAEIRLEQQQERVARMQQTHTHRADVKL